MQTWLKESQQSSLQIRLILLEATVFLLLAVAKALWCSGESVRLGLRRPGLKSPFTSCIWWVTWMGDQSQPSQDCCEDKMEGGEEEKHIYCPQLPGERVGIKMQFIYLWKNLNPALLMHMSYPRHRLLPLCKMKRTNRAVGHQHIDNNTLKIPEQSLFQCL